MVVIDAHHHVWDLAVRDQDWITGEQMAPIRRTFTLDDLRSAARAGRARGRGGGSLVGIRHRVRPAADPAGLRRPDGPRGLRAGAGGGLCYARVVLPHQTPAATYGAREVPGLPLVLDHAGTPPI